MSQQSVTAYFHTRKRRASEELRAKSKVLILDDNDRREVLALIPEDSSTRSTEHQTQSAKSSKVRNCVDFLFFFRWFWCIASWLPYAGLCVCRSILRGISVGNLKGCVCSEMESLIRRVFRTVFRSLVGDILGYNYDSNGCLYFCLSNYRQIIRPDCNCNSTVYNNAALFIVVKLTNE